MSSDGTGRDTVAPDELDYEQARDELAEVVAALEAGGLSLEKSLALWERGETLARVCDRHLAGARERVETALASVEKENGSATA
ncbi:exodeoxyribonuclease VII small subunit [Herbihabitans rhizosphaerae]|uniref:Exodeoxyribonuclease 7 small subunit n=1 Tax=Herbihabitans rhizosphaerae TaxID=1872711 RepID=A0A4Q7L445_9PSEU|nr:exodeoxyribonuclease VII small subunit [Herbihabitans rhizosphaerae]RZS44388.1 exodeoxyribonuclease VII small subunit [Herbihabitans rhizosphaerae]